MYLSPCIDVAFSAVGLSELVLAFGSCVDEPTGLRAALHSRWLSTEVAGALRKRRLTPATCV